MWATASSARSRWPEVALAVYAATSIALVSGVVELGAAPLRLGWASATFAVLAAIVWQGQRLTAAAAASGLAAQRQHDVVRDVSHQLGTPIAVSQSLVELLRRSEASGQRNADLEDLDEELDRVAHLARGMLLLGTDVSCDPLAGAAVDVEDLVVAAVRRCSRTAERAWGVDVRAEGTVPGHRERLNAALDAVIENAIEATAAGDRIVVSVRADGDDAVVEVADRGVGIVPEYLPRVFERCWTNRRGAAARRGTGLGLAIVQAIVDGHGGSVAINSREGHGTTVSLRLPGFVPDQLPAPCPTTASAPARTRPGAIERAATVAPRAAHIPNA